MIPLRGTEVALQFQADGQAGDSGDCNSFGVRYEITDGNQLRVLGGQAMRVNLAFTHAAQY